MTVESKVKAIYTIISRTARNAEKSPILNLKLLMSHLWIVMFLALLPHEVCISQLIRFYLRI